MQTVNIIEPLLQDAGQKGLSIRQLTNLTGISKKNLKWYIYNSKNIGDCDPNVHGSYKTKIRVFVFKPGDKSYIDQRKRVVKRININLDISTDLK